MKQWITILLLAGLLIFTACSQSSTGNNDINIDMDELNIPEDFDFAMTQDVQIELSVYSNNDAPVENIPFTIYNNNPGNGGQVIAKGMTNDSGVLSQSVMLPAYIEQVWAVGFMSTEIIQINGGTATKQYGGSSPAPSVRGGGITRPDNFFQYLSTYNSDGVPDNIDNANIDPAWLARINASLPESQPVPAHHPEYLDAQSKYVLDFIDDCQARITFVWEGAGYKNSLGYYTYNTASGPPANPDTLTHTIIFPNVSMPGSGGQLAIGSSIFLGHFDAGTTVAFFLVANGWDSNNQNVKENNIRYYCNEDYNPENAPYNKHVVMLYDQPTDSILIGFEDLPRPAGDQDFNDTMFFVEVSPENGI
ncbi:MAG: DUF4114 domain-containing protein, partial [Candidatus Cloacimonetes bacterium]|nr:DUF4114 domain-containing protein [Candidatus Cloacimonadota bacterium]